VEEEMSVKSVFAVGLAVLGLIVAVGFGGAAASAAPQHETSASAVKTAKVKGLGVILVNPKGRTLYTFARDQRSRVTCTGKCAKYWPSLKWNGSGKPTAGGSAKSKLLGADMAPGGGEVVTYNKWPLYTYLGDGAAGQANGQDVKLNGGKWYVITPAGTLIKHKP
jgi:predicted lipoprotein with Yx(FWY)xxD motif